MPNPNKEPYKGESLNLGEISEFGGFNTVGEYVARLNRMDPTTSAKGDPMLLAYFEILEGPFEGEEIRFQFWLGARKDKETGRIFAPGVSEFKQACSMIGQSLGNVDFKLDANTCRTHLRCAVHQQARAHQSAARHRAQRQGRQEGRGPVGRRRSGKVRCVRRSSGSPSGAAFNPAGMNAAAANAAQAEQKSPLSGIV